MSRFSKLNLSLLFGEAVFFGALFLQVVASADEFEFFEANIRPLLIKHCYDCHNEENAEGNLRLDLRSGLLKGGGSGPALVPGAPNKSLLIKAVTYRDSKLKMPPPDAGGRLTETQITQLEDWIRAGAPDPRAGQVDDIFATSAKEHWAFQPISVPEIPADFHPVDYLIQRTHEAKGYRPLAQADVRTLIRRLAYDFTGLPPTMDDLATRRSELPELVNRYLASPRYGERWGRHWLDVARYSDAKDGVLMYGDARIRPFAYSYRDYVIRAFNSDTPFDEFIKEQLAADKMNLPENSPKLAGMGLLTLGRLFDNNIHDVIDDQIDVVTRGFLGLTVSCARCHDHKFDPIPTADYYSLYGVFASSEEPYNRPRIEPLSSEAEAFETAYQKKLSEIEMRQTHLYRKTLQDARYRTTRHLVKAATTEPDNLETTIFFLSLIEGQLRPQITYAWRQFLADRAVSGDRIFGPWADFTKKPVLQLEKWRGEGVEPRVVKAMQTQSPSTSADVARLYGDLITNSWSVRLDLEREIEALRRRIDQTSLATINLADLIAGGDGFGMGEAGKAVHPTNGKTVEGSTSNIDAPSLDTFIKAENVYVDGVFIPRESATQIVTSTGLEIHDAPTGLKTGSWDYIKYGPSQGFTTVTINGIDYSKPPNWSLGLHANKGVTIDLSPIREKHAFNTGAFKAVVGHGGAAGMSTIDVAIYFDGKLRYRQKGFSAQQSGPELIIPFVADDRFLTILVTEGKDGNSHDQGFLGNPRIEIGGDPRFQEAVATRKKEMLATLESLEQELLGTQDPADDELAKLLLGEDSPVWFPKRKLYFYLDRQDKDSYRGLLNSLDSIAVSNPNAASRAMIMVDKPQLYDPVIFQRGDPVQTGNRVPRQFLGFLSPDERVPFPDGSGRLNLAEEIAALDNPLTPRVWANRVWMHHFGTPLVEDPSDFGLRNDKPVHAELLDFLAHYLVTNNYQTKPLHRLIVSSAAYQRSSILPAANEDAIAQNAEDPNNRYYWRYTRRRLDLEQMRDTLLTVSGLLDDTMYGRPPSITDDTNNRRTVYSFVERQNLPTIIQAFDSANADTSTSRRPATTVPQQALFSMNSSFIERISKSLAARVAGDQPGGQIEQLYNYVLGRHPTEKEAELGLQFLQNNKLEDYVQVLLVSNEVWFID